MRIRKAEVTGFGQWVDEEFYLKPGLQVIYGHNEAGKSTLLAFLHQILFGFRGRHNIYQRYEPKESERYGGSLFLEDTPYQKLKLERRPGKSAGDVYLRTEDGLVLPEHFLENILDHMTEADYRSLYSFDQSDLQAIKNLKEAELNKLFLSLATSGSQNWFDQVEALEKRAQALYKPSGHKPKINQLIQSYTKAGRDLDQSRQENMAYQANLAEKEKLQAEKRTIEEKKSVLLDDIKEKEGLLDTYPDYQKMMAYQEDLADHAKEVITEAAWLSLKKKEEELNQVDNNIQDLQEDLPINEEEESLLAFIAENEKKLSESQEDLLIAHQLLAQAEAIEDEATYLSQRQEQLGLAWPEEAKAIPEEALAGIEKKGAGGKIKLFIGLASFSAILALFTFIFDQTFLAGVFILASILLFVVSYLQMQKIETSDQEAWKNLLSQAKLPLDWTLADYKAQKGILSEWQSLKERQAILDQKIQDNDHQLDNWLSRQTYLQPWISFDQDTWSIYADIESFFKGLSLFREKIEKTSETKKATEMTYLQKKRNELQENLEKDLKDLGIKSVSQAQAYREAYQNKEEKRLTYQRLKAKLEGDLPKFRTFKSQAAIRETLQEAQVEKNKLDEKIRELDQDLIHYETALRLVEEGGYYQERNQVFHNVQADLEEAAEEWGQIQIQLYLYRETLNLAQAEILPQVMEKASENFHILSQGKYQKVFFEKEELYALSQSGLTYHIQELSQGSQDQVYISIRFAYLELFDQSHLPLMIDDGFLHFDSPRRQIIYDWLQIIAKNRQIIYATSDDTVFSQFQKEEILVL